MPHAPVEWGGTPTSVIDPTHDEIAFIRRLTTRRGEISLQGSIKLLKINRLIPEYVTHASANVNTRVFTLTHQGWKLGSKLINFAAAARRS